MRLRPTRWAASLLALGISTATAVAQTPSAPANAPVVPSPSTTTAPAFPQEGFDYSFDDGSNFYDELDLGPLFRFQADWIFFTRQNRAKSLPLFTGPESVNQRDVDFSYQS